MSGISASELAAIATARNIDIGNRAGLNAGFIVFCGALVLFMQLGYAMIGSGAVREKNQKSATMKNLVNTTVTAITWTAIGYTIAYPPANSESPKMMVEENLVPGDYSTNRHPEFFLGWARAALASTIVIGGIAERCTLMAYITFTIILTCGIYPTVVRYTWGGQDLPSQLQKKGEMRFVDDAGAGVIHMTAGFCSLMGSIVLGARKGRFVGSDGKENSNIHGFEASDASKAIVGTLLAFFGYFGLHAGSFGGLTGDKGVFASRSMVATILSASCGGIMAFATSSALGIKGKWGVNNAGNGILAGLVAVSGVCGKIDTHHAMFVGAVAGLLILGTNKLLRMAKIDDPFGTAGIHGVCGLWGVLMTGYFEPSAGRYFHKDMSLMTAQAKGATLIMVFACTASGIAFVLMRAADILRVEPHIEEAGLDEEFKHYMEEKDKDL